MNKIGLEAMMINEILKESASTGSCAGTCSWCQLCSEDTPRQARVSLGVHTQINQSASTLVLWAFGPQEHSPQPPSTTLCWFD